MKFMIYANKLFIVVVCIAFLAPLAGFASNRYFADTLITVPLGGNAWRTDKDTTGGNISDEGVVNWKNPLACFTAYVRVGHTGKFKLYLDLAVPAGKSKIVVTAFGATREIKISNTKSFQNIYAGEYTIADTGYVCRHQNKGLVKNRQPFCQHPQPKTGRKCHR